MISYFGAHVSVSGGLEKAIENASALGVNSIQIHPSPPQRWNRNPYPPGYEEKFLELKARSSIEKVFFHAIYLINLVSPERDKVEQAKDSLAHYLDLLGRIQGDGVQKAVSRQCSVATVAAVGKQSFALCRTRTR